MSFGNKDICNDYVCADLRDPVMVESVMSTPNQKSADDFHNSFDEVYQLAADMGARAIFSPVIMMQMLCKILPW